MTTLEINNVRVIDPASGLDSKGSVFVSKGRFLSAGLLGTGSVTPDAVLDGHGQYLIPGLVDIAARLREPGFEYKASLESEMAAAAAGGITSIACQPDTDPTLDEPGLVEMLTRRASSLNQSRLFPLGALTIGLKGETLTEMAELSEAGCVGFSQANVAIQDTQVLLRAMQYAKSFGFSVWLQPQDAFLGRGGVVHSGPLASRMGLSGVPVAAETIALNTIFELVRSTGCRVHLCRISSKAGIDLLRLAKAEGLPVTADVAIHHVHLIDMDIGFFDANSRVEPPFRSQRDRDAIRQALADGTIDAICSDHTPVDDDGKVLPFAEAEPGATGLELLLSLTLKWASEEKLAVSKALALVTSSSAKLLGETAAELGRIKAGGPADFSLLDPHRAWIVTRASLKSMGRNTPFLGHELFGRVTNTFVDGREIFSS